MAKARNLLNTELQVINIGLDLFYHSLLTQNVTAVQVDWKPKPKLDPKLELILSKIL
ncbi:MAG TPA: hypothetical protein VK462_02250 [Nitrososphaeraceae archaeon]|nr:hypothetical protein [Nitrososphaeraceae archaeon]